MEEGALLSLTGVIGVKHAGSFSLLRRRHVSRFCASTLRGVLAPAFGGGPVGAPLALGFALALGLP